MGLLAILGFILAIIGVLILVNLIPGGLVAAILLIIGGVLLIAYDRGAFAR